MFARAGSIVSSCSGGANTILKISLRSLRPRCTGTDEAREHDAGNRREGDERRMGPQHWP